MELIDEVIKELDDHIRSTRRVDSEYVDGISLETMEVAVRLLKDQRCDIKRLESNMPKWIPISEESPKEGEIVLLTTPEYKDEEGNEYCRGVQMGYWLFPQDKTWCGSDGVTYGAMGAIGVAPIAWMKKPDSYVGDIKL